MTRALQHTRINPLPVPEALAAGHLDSIRIEDEGSQIVLDYHAYVLDGPGELFERDGRLFERTRGTFQPRRLRFRGVEYPEPAGLYRDLDRLPADHPARTIADLYTWRGKGERLDFYMLFGRSSEDAELRLHARQVLREPRAGAAFPASFERDWSPAPPMPPGLVPQPRSLHRRFGGDPVHFRWQGQARSRRLFIGSLETQAGTRPDVQAVLNLGEHPSRWAAQSAQDDRDRRSQRGEGAQGMSPAVIREEAGWVVERLQAGQRVLVHCVAGMNRSATVCCAVLILLEGLTAEAALERLRATHPWARPDSHHWLALKWLAEQKKR